MCHGISERTGALAGIAAVSEEDDIMLITNEGTIIRTPVSGIPFYSRSAGGVIVMRLAEGSTIVNFARIASEEETAAEAEAADEIMPDTDPVDMDEPDDIDPAEDVSEDEEI